MECNPPDERKGSLRYMVCDHVSCVLRGSALGRGERYPERLRRRAAGPSGAGHTGADGADAETLLRARRKTFKKY